MKSVKFGGQNRTYTQVGDESGEYSLHTLSDGESVMSCWRASLKERVSILLFGNVWICTEGKEATPLWALGVRDATIDVEPHTFQNRMNYYKCQKCGELTVTIDRDKGVTPAMIACRATLECEGSANSAFYPDPFPNGLLIGWEWYKPSLFEAWLKNFKDPGVFEHVKLGGLILKKYEG